MFTTRRIFIHFGKCLVLSTKIFFTKYSQQISFKKFWNLIKKFIIFVLFCPLTTPFEKKLTIDLFFSPLHAIQNNIIHRNEHDRNQRYYQTVLIRKIDFIKLISYLILLTTKSALHLWNSIQGISILNADISFDLQNCFLNFQIRYTSIVSYALPNRLYSASSSIYS